MSDAAEIGEQRPSWLELESAIPLETSKPGARSVKGVTSLSADTIKREFPGLIVQLSTKREGMKLRDALAIAAGKAKRIDST